MTDGNPQLTLVVGLFVAMEATVAMAMTLLSPAKPSLASPLEA
jgi:hypothetical protein